MPQAPQSRNHTGSELTGRSKTTKRVQAFEQPMASLCACCSCSKGLSRGENDKHPGANCRANNDTNPVRAITVILGLAETPYLTSTLAQLALPWDKEGERPPGVRPASEAWRKLPVLRLWWVLLYSFFTFLRILSLFDFCRLVFLLTGSVACSESCRPFRCNA